MFGVRLRAYSPGIAPYARPNLCAFWTKDSIVNAMSQFAPVATSVGDILTRHPRPVPTESLMGYFLRVSHANGFKTPWTLFARCGLEQFEVRGTGIRYKKIAKICNCAQEWLESISYRGVRACRECRLLNHPVSRLDLDLDNPKLCPYCVRQKGFIEAHWDLRFMIGCPVHSCFAVSSCPGCHAPVSWFRPSLLRCECGASFGESSPAAIADAEASLLEVLRAKVLGLLPLADFGAGLPVNALFDLQLRETLRLIGVLHASDLATSCAGSVEADHEHPISAAARILSDWPNRFFELLSKLGSRESEGSIDLRVRFAPLYNALLRGRSSRESAEFIRLAFLDFVSNRWGRLAPDSRLMRELRPASLPRFVTRTEVARSLNIDHRSQALKQVLNAAAVDGSRAEEAKNLSFTYRPVFDLSTIKATTNSPGTILQLRSAAKVIGIPIAVLRKLKESGEYETKHRISTGSGFHELDVARFKHKLLACAQDGTGLGTSSLVTFKQAMSTRYGSFWREGKPGPCPAFRRVANLSRRWRRGFTALDSARCARFIR